MSDNINPAGETLDLPEPQVDPAVYKVENQSVNDVMSELTGAKNTELATSVIAPTVTSPQFDAIAAATPSDVTTKMAQLDTPGTSVVTTAPVSATPTIADDEDLIEKEWVEKAKQIVQRTKDDPHTQNQEIGLYKAEYIKKRFNKDIKTSAEG